MEAQSPAAARLDLTGLDSMSETFSALLPELLDQLLKFFSLSWR